MRILGIAFALIILVGDAFAGGRVASQRIIVDDNQTQHSCVQTERVIVERQRLAPQRIIVEERAAYPQRVIVQRVVPRPQLRIQVGGYR